MSNFTINPSIILCNSRFKVPLTLSFAEEVPEQIQSQLMISNDTQLSFQNPKLASASMLLPCKKNLTFYRFHLYYQDDLDKPMSLTRANLLALEYFQIKALIQKNEKLFFEVDREIEFELLAKSFNLHCHSGNSSLARVLINEFHQAYCVYDQIKIDSREMHLRLILIREDQSHIELAKSFQMTQIISQYALKAMLVKNKIISEIEEDFKIEVNTDPATLQAIGRTEILCKLTQLTKFDCKNCDKEEVLYIEGRLIDKTISCYKGGIELSRYSPLNVSLLFDQTEIYLLGQTHLEAQVVQIMVLSPGQYGFIESFKQLTLQVSHSLNQFNLNCIMIPQSTQQEKLIFTAIQNQTHITCPINREKLVPSTYWLTLGLKESPNYLNFGKTKFQVYQRINVTAIEPQVILSRSDEVNVEVFGRFEGLMQYFAANQNFNRIKLNFTGITDGRRQLKYFDIYSITADKLIVRLGDMKKLVYAASLDHNIALYDLEANIKIAQLDQAFRIIEPILISGVRPLAQFSYIDQINATFKLSESANITTCIQVIDLDGTEIMSPALKVSQYEYQCLTFQETVNVTLGIRGEISQIVTKVSDVHQMNKKGPILIERIDPINGPKAGGTIVNVTGQNFLGPSKFNTAILCRFGSTKVIASLVNNTLILCKAPSFSKSGPVEFSLEIQDPNDFFMTSRIIRFFYEDNIEIRTVVPSFIDQSQSYAFLQVKTQEPVFTRQLNSIFCRLSKAIREQKEGLSSSLIQVEGYHQSSDDSVIICAIPTFRLSHLIPYKLTLSSNKGANFSDSSFSIKVFPILQIVSSSTEILVQGRLTYLHFSIMNLEYFSGNFQCLFSSQKSNNDSDMTYVFPGSRYNQSYVQCDIYPVDSALEIIGILRIQDFVYNLTSVNSVKLRIIRDKILIQKVLPSSHIHIIPDTSVTLQIYLNEPVSRKDIQGAYCRFQNELQRSWNETKVVFLEERLLKCSLDFPSLIAQQIILDTKMIYLQLIVNKESEVFSDAKFQLHITRRPQILEVIPSLVEKILQNNGEMGVLGDNFNYTSKCFLNSYELQSEYINQTYMLCNLTSTPQLNPIGEKKSLNLSVSNSKGIQHSENFPLPFHQSNAPTLQPKTLHAGLFSPTFGPYQGGTKVYFNFQVSDIKKFDFGVLYCDFSSVEQTQFIYVNESYGYCLVPPSSFIQSVPLRLISTDIEHLVIENQVNSFTFMTDFELLNLNSDYFMLTDDSASDMVLTGRNFNSSHSYTVVLTCSSGIDEQTYTMQSQRLSEWNITVNLNQIKTSLNRKCKLQLEIKGQSQLTKHYQNFVYLHVNPIIRLMPPGQVIQRNSASSSYIQLDGINAEIFDKQVECLFELSGWNVSQRVLTESHFLEINQTAKYSFSKIECKVPNLQIYNGKIGSVKLSLYYEDMDHQSNQVEIPVIVETQISKIYPQVLELGKNHTIFITGSEFDLNSQYLCKFTNIDLAIQAIQHALRVNHTHLKCDSLPPIDSESQSLDMSVLNMHTDDLIAQATLTYSLPSTIRLFELLPRQIFHNVSGIYLDVKGDYFKDDCVCKFGNVSSQHTILIDTQNLKCLIPSLQMKDRFARNRTIKGYSTDFSVTCPKSLQKSHEHISLFVRYGSRIKNMSRSYVRENQFELDKTITLRGWLFNPHKICVLRDRNNFTVEMPILQYVDEETVVCPLSGYFFVNDTANEVLLSIKEYDSQNSSMTQESNRVRLIYLPQLYIYENYNRNEEIFYTQQERSMVKLSSNIRQDLNFSYYCLFGDNNQYVSRPEFENQKLTKCPLPYIVESISSITLKLQEVGSDKKVSFSNILTIQLQPLPMIETIDPQTIPAWDNGTWIITLVGKNLIADQTRIFFDNFWYADVTVETPTLGSFIAPVNMPPGFITMRITNNLLKHPSYMDTNRTLEYLKLPELQSLLPQEVPTKNQPQQIIIQGANFTQDTKCLFDGEQSYTTYITSSLLECDAPVIYAGEEVIVQLRQRNMYLNRETHIKLKYYATPYVYKVEPRKAFRNQEGTPVKVYVSNLHSITSQSLEFQFCSFGIYTVQVSKILFELDPKSQTNFTVFVCDTPYLPGSEIVDIEILTENGVFSSSINNKFEFIDPPIISHASPPIAPYGDTEMSFFIDGGEFDPAYEYFCQFKIKMTYLNETKAYFVKNDQIKCVVMGQSLIRHSEYVSIRIIMKNLEQTFAYMLPGTARVLFYDPLHIVRFEPQSGDISGGTEIFIEGFNFDISYGGIWCKIGGEKVPALQIEQYKLIKCVTPPSTKTISNDAVVQVSIDGLNYFSGEFNREVFFQYRLHPKFEKPIPIRQSVWGEQTLLIFGSDFPSRDRVLKILCRFIFTSSKAQIDLMGKYRSDDSLECSTPRHLLVDDEIILQISFNNQNFYEVTTIQNTLTYSEKARIKQVYPTFGFTDQPNFNMTMDIYGDYLREMTEASYGNFTSGIPLSNIQDRSLRINIPSFVNITTLDSFSTYGDNRAIVELKNSIVGSTRDQYMFTYINHFNITTAYPNLVNKDGDILFIEGDNFINTPALNCRFGDYYSTSVRYYNKTKISCGTPSFGDLTLVYEVGVTFNGIEYLYFNDTATNKRFGLAFTSNLAVVSINPELAFSNELNFEVNLRVEGLIDLPTVSCKIHQYITRGTYYEYDGFRWIKCYIPSFDFIKATKGIHPINANNSFYIEVSNNGKDFSTSQKLFKYIIIEQLLNIYPTSGPEIGGTTINLTVADLPNIGGSTGDKLDIAKCYFPGYQAQKAVWIDSKLIQCTSPPLIENIANVSSSSAFAAAQVYVEMLGKIITKFFFTYSKEMRIIYLDPYNANVPAANPEGIAVWVKGSNLLPLGDMIQCQYYYEDQGDLTSGKSGEIIEIGKFINNYTIECIVPPHPRIIPRAFNEARMKIEISLNRGVQFTTDGLVFTYRVPDIMTHMYPLRGFTFGNTYLTIGYEYFYDKSSIRQVCKFINKANQSESFSTRIISFDDKFVYCYTPPAYLISQTLAENGGDIYVRISSNNRDFSLENFIYTYDPVAKITSLSPLWVKRDQLVNVTITGQFFINTNLIKVRMVSSDGARIAHSILNTTQYNYYPPQRLQLSKSVYYVSTTQITFTFPSHIFLEKDFVSIYLKFGEDHYFQARERVFIYDQVQLTGLKPSYAYVRQDNLVREVFVYGLYFWDTQKSGHLKCRYNSDPTNEVQAEFVNSTLVLCGITSRKTAGDTSVEVIIGNVGGEIKSINILPMKFIEEPVIESINTTFYYFNYQHRVPVLVTGRNLATRAGKIYVAVDDTKFEVSIEPNSNSFSFNMPLGLTVGIYTIRVSTDGLYYRPQNFEAVQFHIEVMACPNGKYCSFYQATNCRPGYYCPQNLTFLEVKCPAGLFQPLAGRSTCDKCPVGVFCQEQQLNETKWCPRGYICNNQMTISHNMMTICPDGFICPKNTTYSTTSINLNVVEGVGNLQICPDGYWCTEGTFSLIPDYGLFNSPQQCRDEVVCKNSRSVDNSTYLAGPNDQYGNQYCPRGYFCQNGIAKICPIGHYCSEEQLQQPLPCPYGQYNLEKGQTQCTLCPVGSFCMGAGTTNPTKCRPGYTCQFEGSPYPAQLCPAGSYCTSMTVSNNSFCTLQKEFKPNLCSAATYCLKGAFTPFVDAGNPQSAQKCQAGTYCREGTKDPNGEGKCWPGYYCPSNSPEPLPADPGFFSQGFGNEKQEPCRAGTYQDTYGNTECEYCPRGAECPDQQMRWYQICKAGRYSQFQSQTECTKCPAGTYSNDIGVDNINKCKDCLPKYYCPDPGINTMQKATECQEGQYCVLRTTSEVMFTSSCPAGYYSDFRSSGKEDFYLCDPGFYCTLGTSKTKYKQNNCLQDFYCPRGTAAEIDMSSGKFIESKVYQIQKQEIIEAIQGMLRSTLPVVNNYDAKQRNQDYNDNYKMMLKKEQEYKNRSSMGELEQNLTTIVREIGDISKYLDNLWWENYTFNINKTYVLRRQEYLDEIINEKECQDNKVLPIELRVAYFQLGKNLKCPNGTTSARGSKCLGQCFRKKGTNVAISILDPVNATIRINSADEGDYGGGNNPKNQSDSGRLLRSVDPYSKLRFLQSHKMNSNRSLQEVQVNYVDDDDWIKVIKKEILPEDFNSTYDNVRTYLLKPLEIAKVLLDFTELPQNFYYNEHFAVVILDKNSKQMDLPFYFDPDNNDRTNKKANLEIRILNWQNKDIEFKVAIYLYHGLFQPYLSLLKNKVNVIFYNANRQLMYTDKVWAMFVSRSITLGITLPYNMPDWGKEPEFYIDMTARGDNINPVRRPIDKDVYDSTYWDAQLMDANIMLWLPYFSNCEGQDSRIVVFDIVEYHEKCVLPRYEDIKVVNPIPSTGLDPIADECKIKLKCIYDEPIFQPIASSTRWFAIKEPKDLFFITREPVGIDRIREVDENTQSKQTAYYTLINDGSDELLPVTFYPDQFAEGYPSVVEVNINYYQESKDVKRIAEANVYFVNYTKYVVGDDTTYVLNLNYQALSYFDLINTFQFSIPIYIILFILVAMIQILLIIIFWLFTFIFCPCLIHFKRSPSLRFSHMTRVLFKQPVVGTMMANVPAVITGLLLKYLQDNTWFDDLYSNWSNWGLAFDSSEQIVWKRGRLGLAFLIISCIFMFYGSDSMIFKPNPKQERQIIKEMLKLRKRGRLEMSFEESDDEPEDTAGIELKEQDEQIAEAIQWKRRHYFVNSFFISILFMLKMEFSYTDTFGKNIIMFQIFFAILDIFIEQIVTRVIMGEALMTTPVSTVFTALEFVMTMGADDFQSFIFSYFAEVAIALSMRTYVGPIVEKIELFTQTSVIRLSQRFKFIERIFKNILTRQLNMQLQLINLAEYHDERKDKRTGYQAILEKGEGMEALLGSVSTYSCNTQSMLLVPFVLMYIILFAKETKIPQGYAIAQRELPYYLTFSLIIILPQMIIDVFLLHLLECVWGYKVYDYFTYSEYKFNARSKKWINQESFARSIIHSWRSLDNMSFSQQYYYVSTLMTWGLIYMSLGWTTLLRNQYNPFADPIITPFIVMIIFCTAIIRFGISIVSDYFKVWEITFQSIKEHDVSDLNKLDKDFAHRVLVKNVQTNPFRHKFMRVNREWLIHNIASILGGKNYMKHAGPEFEFLQKIYQRAVNAREIDKKLQVHFDHIKEDLAVMPYNQMDQENNNIADLISDDSISDLPVNNWQIPFQITYDHIQVITKQWIDYAKHNMRLKEMVSDIVAKKMRPKCQRCKSVFRLQVIQKIPFNQITQRYRLYMAGLPFTRARWRRFYHKNQIFITMCMECAYLDNLKGQRLKLRGNTQDESMIATNAVKHIGSHNAVVQANIKKKYVRNVIRFWIQIARSNILHDIKKKAKKVEEDSSDDSFNNKNYF